MHYDKKNTTEISSKNSMILIVFLIGALFCFVSGSNRFAESACVGRTIPTDVALEIAQVAHVQIETVVRLVRRVPLAFFAIRSLLEDVPMPKGVEMVGMPLEIGLVFE